MNIKGMMQAGGSPLGAAAAVLLLAAGAYGATEPVVVGQKDNRYSTESVAVRAGETVSFKNDDETVHNVSVKDDSGNYIAALVEKPGEQKTVLFDRTGDYTVLCMIHPKMRMTVSVK